MRQTSKLFFTSFCILLLICSINQAQVKIKERVELKPTEKALFKTSTTTAAAHSFYAVIKWEAWDAMRAKVIIENECTGEIVESEWGYDGIAETSLAAERAGDYKVWIRTQVHEQYDYSWYDFLIWVDLEVYIDAELVYFGDRTLSKSFTPWFSEISLSADNNELSCDGQTALHFEEDDECGPIIGGLNEDLPLNLTIDGNGLVTFYNSASGADLGAATTVNYSEKDNISLKLHPENFGVGNGEVIVTAELGGYQTTKRYYPRAPRDETIYYLRADPTDPDKLYGVNAENFEVWAVRGGYCAPLEYIPADTKYNLVVTQGAEYGDIGYKANGVTVSQTGTELLDLDHYQGEGKIYFEYRPHTAQVETKTVIINVSTTDPAIEPVDIEITLEPTPIFAYANPMAIKPGETTPIIIKYLDEENGYVDFEEDQEFTVILMSGNEYGNLYSSYEETTDNSFGDTPGPFAFIANNDIFVGEDADKDEVRVVVWVDTYIETDVEGPPIGKKLVSGINSAAKLKELPGGDIRDKLREQVWGKRKTKMAKQKEPAKSNETIVYEKDNVTVRQLNQGVVPIETTSLELVYTEFEIFIKKEKEVEIMLGETKYFALQKKETGEEKEYKIVEIPTTYSEGEKPDWEKVTLEKDWNWEKTDIWGTNPIEVIKKGAKSGVYWEKKYPKFEFYEKDKKYEMKMGDVDKGIIRIIGRFWEDGKVDEYKVKLKAADKAEINIKVVKPTKLLAEGQTPAFSKIRDVKDEEDIEIDEKCIEIGGKLGIPPQVIKGQMEKESSFTNAYRYEPKQDIDCQKDPDNKKRYFGKKFFTVNPGATSDDEKMGTVKIPVDHKNVKPVDYPKDPILIREYLAERIIRYVVLADKNRKIMEPYFLGDKYGPLSIKVQEYFKISKQENPKETDLKKLSRLARAKLKEYIESDEYEDGKLTSQTRIMSSYGLLQQTFYAAHDGEIAGFSVSNKELAPEQLNEQEYTFKAYKEKMTEALKDKSGLTWEKGFEAELNGIFASYNPGEKKYTREVLIFSKKYLPSK